MTVSYTLQTQRPPIIRIYTTTKSSDEPELYKYYTNMAGRRRSHKNTENVDSEDTCKMLAIA